MLSVLVAAVTVVALALGVTVYSLARQAEAPPVAGPSVPQAPQVDPSLLAAPDAEIFPTTLTNGAQVSFVVSKSQNRAAFVSTDLPLPGHYLSVIEEGGLLTTLQLRAFGEEIDVFLDDGRFRTEHRFSLGKVTFLTLHYDITRR